MLMFILFILLDLIKMMNICYLTGFSYVIVHKLFHWELYKSIRFKSQKPDSERSQFN